MLPYRCGMMVDRISKGLRVCAGLLLAAMLLAVPTPLYAQTVTATNTQIGNIDDSTLCSAGNNVIRTFNVTENFTVSDVDIGILATHTWRGDLRFILQGPGPNPVRVQLTNGDVNNLSGDNFNVLLDDNATQLVNTDGNARDHSTIAPPYENTYQPRNPLSAFNNRNSAGTWTLEICDLLASFNGQFRNATLTIRGSQGADLSLTKTVNNAAPASGGAISYTLRVINAGSSTDNASNVVVSDVLPTGFTFTSASGNGTYDSALARWTLGTVPIGATRTITITGTVNASPGATVTNVAEIIASSAPDPDSTVNNGSVTEDDYAQVSFTVAGPRTAGIPPALVCPKGAVTFDWTGRAWPAGSTSNNYTLLGVGSFNWSISNPATYLNVATLGGQQPALTDNVQNQRTLSKGIDFDNPAQFATTTIAMGNTVSGAQFRIFDVDYFAGSFADRVKVYGIRNGTAGQIIPILTNGSANYVIGNEAFGDVNSGDTSPAANVVVTFQQSIDTIVIEYGSHTRAPTPAPANPTGQAIQMSGGISICAADGTLSVAKSSTVVEDPVNGTNNPFLIPGATVRYCILITNTGLATANSVVGSDPLPTAVTFVPGSILSGTNCANAATVEDDNATGGDESDPAGASFSANVVSYSNTGIAGGATAAMTFRATVN